MIKLAVLIAATGLITSPVLAEDKITVASSGFYDRPLYEFKSLCKHLMIEPNKEIKGGALGNLEALVNNDVSLAFLHSDLIHAAAKENDSYEMKYKTLISLYPEDIHVLALRNSTTKTGGLLTKEFNTLSDLAGFNVGATGSAAVTMRLLNEMADADLLPFPFLMTLR